MSKEAMTLALEALKYDADYDTSVTLQKAAIYALENAIAEAEKQEPYVDVVSHWHYWMAEADKYRFALQNLEEALAKQEQGGPVEWGVDWGKDGNSVSIIKRLADGSIEVLAWEYAPHPQPAQKPLTDEQITGIAQMTCIGISPHEDTLNFARVIEAAHGIKENT